MKTSPTDSLLLSLYGCCSKPSGWTGVLQELSADLDASFAVAQRFTMGGPRVVPLWTAHNNGFDMSTYGADVSDPENPRYESRRVRKLASLAPRVGGDNEIFGPDESEMRLAVRQRSRRIGLGDGIVGIAPLEADRYFALVVFRKANESADFSVPERERLLHYLPHFAQAVSLTESVAFGESAATLVNGHLDRWPSSLVLCDSRGQVQWMNRRAKFRMSPGNELQLCDGVLQMNRPSAQSKLSRAMAEAIERAAPTFLAIDTPRGRLQLAVQPLESSGEGAASQLLISFACEEQDNGHIPSDALMALFDFTDAEARLASALVSGITVDQYAQNRGVKIGTVRTQLNQVLGKSGAHRQADLVRRVLCSAAAALPLESRRRESVALA